MKFYRALNNFKKGITPIGFQKNLKHRKSKDIADLIIKLAQYDYTNDNSMTINHIIMALPVPKYYQ
jgi:hypothetical protein